MRDHGVGELVAGRRQRRPARPRPARGAAAGAGDRFGRWSAGLVADPADDVRQRREVAQLEGVVAGDAEVAADAAKTSACLTVSTPRSASRSQVDVEQLRRVAGRARTTMPTTASVGLVAVRRRSRRTGAAAGAVGGGAAVVDGRQARPAPSRSPSAPSAPRGRWTTAAVLRRRATVDDPQPALDDLQLRVVGPPACASHAARRPGRRSGTRSRARRAPAAAVRRPASSAAASWRSASRTRPPAAARTAPGSAPPVDRLS